MKRLARLKACAAWTPVLLALACGGSGDNGPSTFGFPTTGSGGAPTGSGSGTGTGTGTGTAAGAGNSQVTPGTVIEPGRGNITEVVPVQGASACEVSVEAGKTDLDIFIMMDKSMTMTENTASGRTKWVDINNAVKQFTVDPSSAGIGVGIGFFAIFLTHSPCPASGCISCNIADYARPVVDINLLNGNAPAIGSAIDNVVLEGGNPNGETPTRVALAGAIQYAQSYAAAHPARRVVVALATDGLPNVCDSSVDSVLQVARNGVNGTPSIKTYVLGILAASSAQTADKRTNGSISDDIAGDELPNLNKMAQAGGTGSVFLIDTTGTATGQFVRAMNSIRDANDVGCQFDIPTAPSGQRLDLGQANVTYGSLALPWRSLTTACGTGDGFYYDNNAYPTTIRLCAATCEKVKVDPSAMMRIVVGCPAATGSGGTGGSFIPGDTGQGGHGGEPDATATCLLDGQVCSDASECCSGSCSPTTGTCGVPIF